MDVLLTWFATKKEIDRFQKMLPRGSRVMAPKPRPVLSRYEVELDDIAAHLPKAERTAILNARPRPKLTPSTPTTLSEIEARLAKVREVGYAVSDQDAVVGLRVLATPLLDRDNRAYAALSVAAPVGNRTMAEFVEKSAGPVMDAAAKLAKMYRTRGGAAPADLSL